MIPRALVLVSTILLVSLAISSCGSDTDEPAPTSGGSPAGQSAPVSSASGPQGDVVKVVNQDPGGSGKYQFVPSQFKFKSGQTVTFSMSGESEFHTFTVDELKLDQSVNAKETMTFTHTFDKPGTYKLYCIPHEALGMTGTITVE